MSLHGAPLLIVESEIGSFITSLQQAVEAAGAESVVARNASEAEQHCDQLQFTAALLNVEHRTIEDDLSARGLPVLLYSRASMPRAIIASLQRLLEVGR
jgi:hypothetical protein